MRYLGYYSNATRGKLKKQESQPEWHIIGGDNLKDNPQKKRITADTALRLAKFFGNTP